MHEIDVAILCLLVVVLIGCMAILARQRFMLRAPGSIPVALRVDRRGAAPGRWQYGVGRFSGDELRWYRSLGVATRPSTVFERRRLVVVSRRAPLESELTAVPATAVVVECRDGDVPVQIALGEGAYTGFVSWLESSSPRP